MIWSRYNCVEEVDFTNANNFFEYIRPTQVRWGNGDAVEWFFRGQADITWELVPRAWRTVRNPLFSLSESFYNYLTNEILTKVERLARKHHFLPADFDDFFRYFSAVAAEYDAVKHFSSFADELAQSIDGSDELNSGLKYINNSIKNESWPDVIPNASFGIAQHHGIPTRLMDWTRKPLIGAYFASALPTGLSGSKIALWAINVPFLVTSDKSYGLKILTTARAQDSFLHAQDGLFIWHQNAGEYRRHNHVWPSLLDSVELCYSSGVKPVKVISLPHSEVPELKKLLWRERISLAHLMPTHDNIARTIVDSWASFAGLRVNVTAYGE